MTKLEKLLQKMRDNPRGDFSIQQIKSVATHFDIKYRQPKRGSHVVFRAPDGEKLSIPAKRPIKPIYIKKFLLLIDGISS